MRRQALQHVCATCRFQSRSQALLSRSSKRYVQISATSGSTDVDNGNVSSVIRTDDGFSILSSTSSLLSARLSASTNLYTRKGTLVALRGKAENAISTLHLLNPVQRALTGIPFIYQRVTSTTPYEALIAPKSTNTSLTILNLDGREDWMIAQRNALVAWTGHTLKLTPKLNANMSLAHWGNTSITGRGLLALSGRGQTHQITLKTNEKYVVHPSHILAYNLTQHAPAPYRFKSTNLRFQIPALSRWIPDTKFWRTMREATAWRWASSVAFTVRTWARRTIWGDRLFLEFKGPATIYIQSRGSGIRDVLTDRDVNEIADSPAGSAARSVAMTEAGQAAGSAKTPASGTTKAKSATSVTYATVKQGGNVKFDEQKAWVDPSRPAQDEMGGEKRF